MTYRLVRNLHMERWVKGHTDPFAPLYDVEELDAAGVPVRVVFHGGDAEAARRAIATLGGQEVAA